MTPMLIALALAGGCRCCCCCGPPSPAPAPSTYVVPMATAADYEADARRWLEIDRRMRLRGERLIHLDGREYLVRDPDHGPPRPPYPAPESAR